jgi:BirA family transcriptional regulator, biotin operon repressor / biotin---[acetyl-CoA-carboxylase] ligase
MAAYTDSPSFGAAVVPPGPVGAFAPGVLAPDADRPLLDAIFGDAPVHTAPLALPGWDHLLAVEHASGSQYDRLISLSRETPVADRVACVAGSGRGFHGFRGRAWTAAPGNIHLTVHFAPQRPVLHFATVFTALAAVCVTEAIDTVPGLAGRARIKWVNDVLVDGAKVAGVLAYTQTRSDVVSSVVLGIGLNVEATPAVERTAFVPAAGSLRALAPEPATVKAAPVLAALLDALQRGYARVLNEGHAPVMEAYRARSAVVGQHVTVCEEGDVPGGVIAAGRVEAVGDGLELYLEGRAEPVTRGRLILGEPPRKAGS